MSTVEVGGVDSFWLPFTLTEEVHRNLRDATKEEEKWSIVRQTAKIDFVEDNPRAFAIFEYLFQNLMFCEEEQYDYQQASTFLGIVQKVFDHCVPEDADHPPTAEDAVSMFSEQLLSCISEHKQKGEILFPVKAVERLTTFFARTFVRNLKAFQLVCHELHRERTETRLLSVQTPLIPLPLRCSLEEAAAAAVSVHIAESHVSHE